MCQCVDRHPYLPLSQQRCPKARCRSPFFLIDKFHQIQVTNTCLKRTFWICMHLLKYNHMVYSPSKPLRSSKEQGVTVCGTLGWAAKCCRGGTTLLLSSRTSLRFICSETSSSSNISLDWSLDFIVPWGIFLFSVISVQFEEMFSCKYDNLHAVWSHITIMNDKCQLLGHCIIYVMLQLPSFSIFLSVSHTLSLRSQWDSRKEVWSHYLNCRGAQ